MRLSKEAILKAPDLPAEEVSVPEWAPEPGMDATVLVRGMTGAERDRYEQSLYVERGGQMVQDTANATAKAVTMCVVDDDGTRVFADGDANELGQKSAAALMRVWRVIRRLSGLGAEAVQEATADFTQGTGSGSSTGSPNGSAAPSPVS